jgi:L-histidine Nalpha-methyltransferase
MSAVLDFAGRPAAWHSRFAHDVLEGLMARPRHVRWHRPPLADHEAWILDQCRPAIAEAAGDSRPVHYSLGSALGAQSAAEAVETLRRIGQSAGPQALLVVGLDATRDAAQRRATQAEGADFAQTLLARIDAELNGDFAPSAFRFELRDGAEGAIETHLVSEYTQQVRVLGQRFVFARGESIRTDASYAHGLVKFQAMAHRAGWNHLQLWMDASSRYAVHVLERT